MTDTTAAAGAAGARRSLTRRRLCALAAPALAAVIGAGVALAGFTPFTNANTALGVAERPWAVVAMPARLLAWTALAAAVLLPGRRELVGGARSLAAGALLLGVAGFVSILDSGDPARSATFVLLAISAPMLMFAGLVHSRLSARWLAGGFLVALVLALLRADAVFLRDWGLPGPADLHAAKYSSVPYDFDYYALGNPDHTAGFLLMPLCLALFWVAGRRSLVRWQRAALGCAAAVCAFTLVLTYARAAIATAIAAVALLVLVLPLARRTRVALLTAVAAATTTVIVVTWDYVATLWDTDRDASVPERLWSLKDGLVTLADHPVSGLGLGEYAADVGYFPAHSSIIQAGAEMGVLGLCALAALTAAGCVRAVHLIRRQGWFHMGSAAAIAFAVYALHAAVAAPATAGLFSGYNSAWGLAAALMLALSFMPDPEPG